MNDLARSVLLLYSYDENPDDTSADNLLTQSIKLIGLVPGNCGKCLRGEPPLF